jgi:hypothetical protein
LGCAKTAILIVDTTNTIGVFDEMNCVENLLIEKGTDGVVCVCV